MNNIFNVKELLEFNEVMVGRGMPNSDDGVGYNKADYSVCSSYYEGLSDSQIVDLAKRLVKYSNTQLHIDKQKMKDTYEYYSSLIKSDKKDVGVSVYNTEEGIVVSFRYNDNFTDTIRSFDYKERKFNMESKKWIVSKNIILDVLIKLKNIGADVDNAIKYIKDNKLATNTNTAEIKKEILTKIENDIVFLKFDYNKEIIDEIKKLDKKDRQWNQEYKFWAINIECLDKLKSTLSSIAEFKFV